ncbi:hypothetical protein V6N11_060256 [Hibiscus sabdariffa]
MSLAYDLGYRCLEVESDSLDAINLVKGLSAKQNCPTLALYIHESCNQSWEVRFSHIQREGNEVADHLAKLAHMDNFDLVAFPQPPRKFIFCWLMLV